MLKIALVGNIASGKSTVENFLSELGYRVFDSDKICHNILETSQEIFDVFKDYDVLDNGKINREKLGQLIFSSPDLKKKLEEMTYKDLKIEFNNIFTKYGNEKFIFISVPLLFEAQMENLFDKTIFIFCDNSKRLERLIKRNGYSLEYAKIRMSAQIPQEEKLKKADYIIYNNSSIENLKAQTLNLIEQIH
jgi:dephospho-CoA kinase